jgi:hypothetical protein
MEIDFLRYKNNLRFSADADIESANEICNTESAHEGTEDDNGLPEACEEGVIISHDKVLATEVVDNVQSSELERRAAHCIHKGTVRADLRRDDGNLGLELDVTAGFVSCGQSLWLAGEKLTLRPQGGQL